MLFLVMVFYYQHSLGSIQVQEGYESTVTCLPHDSSMNIFKIGTATLLEISLLSTWIKPNRKAKWLAPPHPPRGGKK